MTLLLSAFEAGGGVKTGDVSLRDEAEGARRSLVRARRGAGVSRRTATSFSTGARVGRLARVSGVASRRAAASASRTRLLAEVVAGDSSLFVFLVFGSLSMFAAGGSVSVVRAVSGGCDAGGDGDGVASGVGSAGGG
jgi:hypothetical protein